VEFQRRGALHLNLVIKGVPIEDDGELLELLCERWCARVDALPVGQWVGRIEDAAGVTRYLQKTLAHGLKREQAPPIGWRGHRTSQTRGYLVRPASVMRQEAREALRDKREIWRAAQRGEDGIDVELSVAAARQLRNGTSWRLYKQPSPAIAGPGASATSAPTPNPALVDERRTDGFVTEMWRAIASLKREVTDPAHAGTHPREGQKRQTITSGL
jgi:hypothetical protein